MSKLAIDFDDKKIDAIFAELNQCEHPGAAVGISIAGRPVYRKGFGLADLELPLVLSPSTRMRIGSTSKQFAAFAYMLLCEKNLAKIDDKLGMHFPELHSVTNHVTMRQLMGNISGLRDVTDLVLQLGTDGRRVSTDDFLRLYQLIDDVNAPPGERYIYNNGGWILLSVMIERITDQPLEQALSELVFRPIGMHDTLLRRWDAELVRNSATCHMQVGPGKYERTEIHGGLDYVAAGSIASTVDDMLRWTAHMDSPVVGNAETWRLMRSSQVLDNGTRTDYGLGLCTQRYREVEILEHSGGGRGSNAQMLKVPALGLDVVVLCNRSDRIGATYAEQIIDACIPMDGPAPTFYQGIFPCGVFRSPRSGRVVRLRTAPSHFSPNTAAPICAIDGFEAAVEENGEGGFKAFGGAAAITAFSITPQGEVVCPPSLRLVDWGNIDVLDRVEESVPGETEAACGTYRLSALGAVATIFVSDQGPAIRFVSQFGATVHDLELVARSVWSTRARGPGILPPWGTLAFDSDGRGFRLSNYMTRNLRFVRVASSDAVSDTTPLQAHGT